MRISRKRTRFVEEDKFFGVSIRRGWTLRDHAYFPEEDTFRRRGQVFWGIPLGRGRVPRVEGQKAGERAARPRAPARKRDRHAAECDCCRFSRHLNGMGRIVKERTPFGFCYAES
jgi:hypothetical protein